MFISQFGDITYYKGASFMRMVDSVLGLSVLMSGLANYLGNNMFGTTR